MSGRILFDKIPIPFTRVGSTPTLIRYEFPKFPSRRPSVEALVKALTYHARSLDDKDLCGLVISFAQEDQRPVENFTAAISVKDIEFNDFLISSVSDGIYSLKPERALSMTGAQVGITTAILQQNTAASG